MPSSQVHSRTATALAAVERALAELRRGGIVVLRDEDGAGGLVVAAEACGPLALQRLQGLAQDAPVLITTRRRAEAIGMEIPPHIAGGMGEINKPITLDLPEGVPVDIILRPHESGPQATRHVALRHLSRPIVSHAPRIAQTAIELAYEDTASRNLQQVAQAHVPLEGAENARILAWRPSDGGKEHLAIVVGEIDPTEPVLIRLHSECFTGDLLGSLRCDCGVQLRGAIVEIAKRGSGVLLYLAQEGRGIGLVNKLRAYELQDDGFDTIDANEQLGFDADERIYAPAATILGRMGIKRVRLMTNNPEKISQLERFGVEVVARVQHSFPANGHNENYLRTKALRAGHLL